MPNDPQFDEATTQALEELFELYISEKQRLLNALKKWEVKDAEDLIQEAFLRVAWRLIRRGPVANLRAYVYGAVTNGRRDLYHGNGRRERCETAAGRDRSRERRQEQVGDADRRLDFYNTMLLLSPREREVVVLRYVADFTPEDVAEVLGIKVNTVRSYLERAHKKLEVDLGEEQR